MQRRVSIPRPVMLNSMRLVRYLGAVSLLSIFSNGIIGPLSTSAQTQTFVPRGEILAQNIPLAPHQPIPDAPFRSWSLFLACDPAWLLPGQDAARRELQTRYQAFGKTTGDNHAAVWFEGFSPKRFQDDGRVLEWSQLPGSIDVDRSVIYCRKFQLIPSQGPHVVVIAVHPDRWESDDSKVVLAFGGRSAREMQDQLSKLNDQISAGRLSQKELNSAAWWNAWREAIETGCQWLSKVKWSVDAKALKVERSGVCS